MRKAPSSTELFNVHSETQKLRRQNANVLLSRFLKNKPQGGSELSQSFATSANLVKGSEQKQQPPTRGRPPLCPICEDKHFIAKCATFNKATADERFEMLKTLRLCFSCFKTNHVSSECRSRSTCDKCGKQHHTLLHGTTPKQSSSTGPPQGDRKSVV